MRDQEAELALAFPGGPRGFREFLAARIVAALLGLLAIAVIDRVSGTSPDIWFVIAVAILSVLLTAPYYAWASHQPGSLSAIALIVLLVDVALITVGEYFLGGENVVYGMPLYLLLVVLAAVTHSSAAAYAVACFASVAFASMVLATRTDWLPNRAGAFPAAFSDIWPWATVLVNSVTTVGIAVISGSLAGITRRALLRSRGLERELRVFNRELERRVETAVASTRTANIALAAKNETLEATLREIDLFARAVSHDLRNTITAAGESLRVGRQDGSSRDRFLGLAADNLNRADRMLVGLRDLMRSMGGESDELDVDVRSAVEQVVEELSAARGGAHVPVRIIGTLGNLRTRPAQLALVFRNLIGNALDHNPRDPRLAIEVGRREGNAEMVFFVRDNGNGIPPALVEKIFEPFRRGPEAEADGLGLGLSLVGAVVIRAGGKVWVESEAGHGATFCFTFPDPSETLSPSSRADRSRQDSAGTDLRSERLAAVGERSFRKESDASG